MKKMKKNVILLLAILFIASANIYSQSICECVPDPNCIDGTLGGADPEDLSGEMCPMPEDFPQGTVGVQYNLTLTIIPPTTYMGLSVIQKIRIDNVVGIPDGLSWCRDIEQMTSGVAHCINMSGTPTTAGTYNIYADIVPFIPLLGELSSATVQDTLIGTIIINDAIEAPICDFSVNTQSGVANDEFSFTYTGTAGTPDSYLWNFGDGNTSTEQNPTHTYTEDGTYTVSLYVENTGGNDTETKTDYITIDTPFSVKENITSNINVFPNPASEKLTVVAENIESITILDAKGLVVYYSINNNSENNIDISNFPVANYIIKIKTRETMISKSFLKK